MTFKRPGAFTTLVNLFCVLVLLGTTTARAQNTESADGMFPPMATGETGDYSISANEPTHPLIRITPDKSEIVRLNEDVTSILIGNPAHLSVILDSPRTLVLVPRGPGATFFSALGKNGRVIMQRHVIVASPKEKYIRVRSTCNNAGTVPCEETRVFYCPDMCHEIRTPEDGTGASLQSEVSASGTSTAASSGISASNSGAAPEEEEEQEEADPIENEETTTGEEAQ